MRNVNWLWLFPLTYAVHIAEEMLAGERFYIWIRHISGRTIGGQTFLILNLVFWVGMVGAILVARSGRALWLIPALGALVAVNGLGHLIGTFVAGSYSPGVVSGVVLWIPLGVYALWRSRREMSGRVLLGGIVAGVVVMAMVMVLALLTSRAG
jgi:hypothetical protein